MSKSKSKDTKKITSKKKFQRQIMDNLVSSLPGLEEILGEKKFNTRIKKASKLLSEGIKEKADKKNKSKNRK